MRSGSARVKELQCRAVSGLGLGYFHEQLVDEFIHPILVYIQAINNTVEATVCLILQHPFEDMPQGVEGCIQKTFTLRFVLCEQQIKQTLLMFAELDYECSKKGPRIL